MFAVIKTGGKQYRVAADDVITIERLAAEPGEAVTFEVVVMLADGDDIQVGAPVVAGATVSAEVVELTRGPKVIAFKKRRRQNSKRKRGHRQDHTVVRITDILLGGKSVGGAAKAEAKPAKAKKAKATEPAASEAAPAEAPAAEQTA